MTRFFDRKEKYLPESFYNIKADLTDLSNPPLHPGTKKPVTPEDLSPIFPMGFIAHEGSTERFVPIPSKVLEKYAIYRPTPLVYAKGLKEYLGTPAEIFYKYEGTNPAGSHKSNTAIVQAFLASEEGIHKLVTETGAGQWGSALAQAGAMFHVDVDVYMVRVSFRQKPGRRIMMEMNGAHVFESPSSRTNSGRHFFEQNHNHPGSLGIAISEAVETVVTQNSSKYALGSVLDAVLMHQTVIGQEAIRQLEEAGVYPDLVIGCVGGGSNFAGIAFPFLRDNLVNKKKTRFIAVEPESCPTLTKGELRYDFGDSSGLTPLLYMHTLGMDFVPPEIHAGGLRYHGMAPLVSHLYSGGHLEAYAISQDEVFKAGKVFLQTEGILPAPESSHAIAVVIEEALKAKAEGRKSNILFNLSGNGFFDIAAFEQNGHGK